MRWLKRALIFFLMTWPSVSGAQICTQCCFDSPPDARVESFTAFSEAGGIHLFWQTLTEENTSLFDISRSTSPSGPFSIVGDSIPAVGTDSSGATYEYMDPSGSSGDYYLLMETETDGTRMRGSYVIRADELPGQLNVPIIFEGAGLNLNYAGVSSGPPPN